jgi:hypothetical protein
VKQAAREYRCAARAATSSRRRRASTRQEQEKNGLNHRAGCTPSCILAAHSRSSAATLSHTGHRRWWYTSAAKFVRNAVHARFIAAHRDGAAQTFACIKKVRRTIQLRKRILSDLVRFKKLFVAFLPRQFAAIRTS